MGLGILFEASARPAAPRIRKLDLAGNLLLVGSLVFALGMLVHDFAQSEEPGAAHRSCIALAFKQGYESRAAAVPFLEECMGTIGAGWEFAADQTLHPACDLGADSHYDSRCWLPMQRAQQEPSAAQHSAMLR